MSISDIKFNSVNNKKLKKAIEKKTNTAVNILMRSKPMSGMDNAIIAVAKAPRIAYKMGFLKWHSLFDIACDRPHTAMYISIINISRAMIAIINVIIKMGTEDTSAKKASAENSNPNKMLRTMYRILQELMHII